MKSRLIVKNFGPIKDVDLDLRNVNVFIGPQASGKSALAKLFTICSAPRRFLKNGNSNNFTSFKNTLEDYNIQSFLQDDTEIAFESDLHDFKLRNREIAYTAKLRDRIDSLAKSCANVDALIWGYPRIKDEIESLEKQYDSVAKLYPEFIGNISDERKFEICLEILYALSKAEEYLSTTSPLYIPSERNFIYILGSSISNLLYNNVPIPKHILLLGAEIEKSKKSEIELNFLQEGMYYKLVNGEPRIFTKNGNNIKLTEAAAGIQSAVSLLLPILANNTDASQRHFAIEEPELNLFPTAQYELIKRLESLRTEVWKNDIGSVHLYTTHSPYVLSAFNNLLYASKVWNAKGTGSSKYDPKIESSLKAILPTRSNVQPSIFSAYEIDKGTAESILDRESGLISDNYIDDASDKMDDDFEALMDLMR